MKTVFFLVSFMCLFLLSSQAADMNTTLEYADKTVYKKLLLSLEQEKNVTSETALEKSLLEILLRQPQKHMPTIALRMPKNSNDYRILFAAYIDIAIHNEHLRRQLKNRRQKIKTIESEIYKLDQNDPKLLSYQLQDALYHHNTLLYNKEMDIQRQQMQKILKILTLSLEQISIDSAAAGKMLSTRQALVQKLHLDINRLQIDKEQTELVNDKTDTLIIDRKIQKIQKLYAQAVKETATYEFLLFSHALKRKEHQVFALAKTIKALLGSTPELSVSAKAVMALLESMEKHYLGQIETFEGSGIQELKDIFQQSWELVNRPIFMINKTPISVFKLFWALVILVAGFLIGSFYKGRIQDLSLNRHSLTTSTRTILANIGYYIILLIAFFMTLNVLGIKLSSLALVAGALSVGIGFGLKNIVSNLVSGLILMFERSVKIGDYVELDDTLKGYITDIRMRSTTINTNDNIDIIVPNQRFIESNVVNWTMRDNLRRFFIPFGVKYGTDPQQVMDIVMKAVMESEYRNEIHDAPDKRNRVIMTGMGDSSVDFELLVWIEGAKMRRPKRTKSEFLVLIYKVLYENNIEIPFPQRDLHIRSVDEGVSFMTECRYMPKERT
ncbi:Potassium efflux system KefA protein / Small-conductance mechanosensitive channel [hydrothermal vent metagenome]|uniref:Potassium efflux system KefA protein / Small-conductance mechanosensitive channel n=1 Tax=hydrothermal vent metagenome TaxID=652676 RepID=A0A1W1CSI2_9ZZZZ